MLKFVTPAAVALMAAAAIAQNEPAAQAPREAQQQDAAAQQDTDAGAATKVRKNDASDRPDAQPRREGRDAAARRDRANDAQNTTTESTTRTTNRVDASASAETTIDNAVANCLILANQEEIALARFAVEHSENAEVKALAQMLIQDHEAFLAKLQQHGSVSSQEAELSTTTTTETRTTARSDAADRPNRDAAAQPRDNATQPRDAEDDASRASNAAEEAADRTENSTATRRAATSVTKRTSAASESGADISQQMFQLAKDQHTECLRLTKEALVEAKQAGEFDMAFLGQQQGAHIGMLAALKGSEGHVSGEFAQLLQQAHEKTMQHKQKIHDVKKSLAAAK